MDYLELVSHLLLKPSSTDCFRPTRLLSPCTHQFLLGVWENTGLRTNCHPLKPVKIHPVSPLKLEVCQKPTFLITSTTLQNHHFYSCVLSKIRLSPSFPLFLAIQHPHGSLNKVTLHCFPTSLALEKVRCLSCSALSLPDTSLMNNIGRRRVLNLGSRHSLWLMPLIHSTWLMNAFPNINTCHHLWEFKNPHRGSNHTLAYQCLKFLSSNDKCSFLHFNHPLLENFMQNH